MYNFRPNYNECSVIMTCDENKLPGHFENPFQAIEALEDRLGKNRETEDLRRYYNMPVVKEWFKENGLTI